MEINYWFLLFRHDIKKEKPKNKSGLALKNPPKKPTQKNPKNPAKKPTKNVFFFFNF
jgi:hypothetical protein